MLPSRWILASVLCAPLLLGCPMGHQSPQARAQEAVRELNVNTRFNRMQIAADGVAPEARPAFFERRKHWGGAIRIGDYELAGFKMDEKQENVDVYVKVAWYRADEGDLHVTTLKQRWTDKKGSWKLVDEYRADGEIGLIGEPIVRVAAPEQPKNAQFPTIRLGDSGGDPGATSTRVVPAQ